ncbi:MAG: DUF1707 domain-containing protein [Gemmatimonadota bacterium]
MSTVTFPERPLAPAYAPAPSVDDRERVVQALCAHFAADQLTMDSLDARLSAVYGAQTIAQLEELVGDLPVLPNDKMNVGRAVLAPSELVPARGVVMAFMGGVSRTGNWLVPRQLKAVAVMGGAEIDLRDARFAPGVTEIEVFALMGGVEITVPRGVRVELLGGAVMGGFASAAGEDPELDSSSPVLRVSGFALMGGVDVRVKKPSKKVMARFERAVQAAQRLGRG